MQILDTARAVAAKAYIIISIITKDEGVRGFFTGSDGFLAADIGGKLFIEMRTCSR